MFYCMFYFTCGRSLNTCTIGKYIATHAYTHAERKIRENEREEWESPDSLPVFLNLQPCSMHGWIVGLLTCLPTEACDCLGGNISF